jgi:hypothetical protein
VRWGRSAGARCQTRRRRASECVRAARGVYNRDGQPAAGRNARHNGLSELAHLRALMRAHVGAYSTLPA